MTSPWLTAIGWAVVHSLWLGALVAGVVAVVLSFIRDAHARTRELVAGAGLVLLVVAPIAITIGAVELVTPGPRTPMARALGDAIDLSVILWWRSLIVRTAAVLWLAGLVLAVGRIVVECRRAGALRRDSRDDAGDAVREVVADLRAQLHVAAPVDIRALGDAGVPMVLGWWRPVILLPLQAVHALRADQLRAIIAHELAHVRRRDYLANLWQLAAETLLFHHPAARWLSHRIRTEREYCCDDVAVGVSGDAGGYARALAALEDARGECRLAVAAASGTLLDRIRRIVGEPRPTLTKRRAAVILAVTSIVAAVLFACVTIIPPAVPLDAKLRRRSPAPPGVAIAAPDGPSLPRKAQR